MMGKTEALLAEGVQRSKINRVLRLWTCLTEF